MGLCGLAGSRPKRISSVVLRDGIDALMVAPVCERLHLPPSRLMEKHLIYGGGSENGIGLASISSWVISVECAVPTRNEELDWIPGPSMESALRGQATNHNLFGFKTESHVTQAWPKTHYVTD